MRRLSVLTCLLVACGGGGSAPQDATADGSHVPPGDGGADAPVDAVPDAPFTPVPPPSNPLPITNNGGAIVATPSIVFLSYAGDPNASAMASFLSWFPTSTYFAATLSEYGITSGTFAGSYTFGTTVPTNYTLEQFKADLDAKIANGDFGPVTTSTVYALLAPPSFQVRDEMDGTACHDFSGFHTATPAGHPVALTYTCNGYTFDDLTGIMSHELAELTTDPQPRTSVGFNLLYMNVRGGEVADLCEDLYIKQDGYLVTRVFSNAAAAAGQDPCVPADPAISYIGVAMTDTTQPGAAAGSSVTTHWQAFATQRPPGPMKFVVVAGPQFDVTVTPCAGNPSIGGCAVAPGDTFTIDVAVKPDTVPGYGAVAVYSGAGTQVTAQWNLRVATAPTTCDALAQDCPSGEGCQRWWDDTTHEALGGCVAAGTGGPGATCNANNDCAPGLECAGGGTCVAYCGVCDPSNPNDPCSLASTYQASSTYCDPLGPNPTYCTQVFVEPAMNGAFEPTQVVCAPGCDIYNPATCTDMFGRSGACYYEWAGLKCESVHGNVPTGGACSVDYDCVPGETCWAGKCAATCRVSTASGCATGARCIDMQDMNVPDIGLCDPPCDIFNASTCSDVFGNSGACYYENVGLVCESSVGTIAIGATCTYANDCVPGAMCLGSPGTCYRNCHVGTANACPNGQTCYDLQDPNAPGLGACN